MHSNLFYENDPNQKGGPSHADTIQIQGGTNMVFRGNTIDGAYSSALQTTQDRAAVSGVTVTNNWIDGGGCSINIAIGSKFGPIQGFSTSNNVFGTSQRHSRCAIVAPTTVTVGNVGNVFTDGAAVKVSKGS
jgi:hypothetical protein